MGKKSLNVKPKQARVLCTMTPEKRLAFIAEGLPIILSSAEGYWDAACRLNDTREGMVLQNHAAEEAAKVLILMDAVRCPKKLVASRMGTIVQSFYSHLARIIYAEAVHWNAMNVAQLRERVDSERASPSVEGDVGQFIFPNWNIFTREGLLYADIICVDNEEPVWKTPNHDEMGFPLIEAPLVLELTKAMSAVGLFTLEGLKATSEIWEQMTFTELESSADNRHLKEQLLQRLQDEGLPTATATQSHFKTLLNTWQIPMYDFDFGRAKVSQTEN